jgi:hypothetical protein
LQFAQATGTDSLDSSLYLNASELRLACHRHRSDYLSKFSPRCVVGATGPTTEFPEGARPVLLDPVPYELGLPSREQPPLKRQLDPGIGTKSLAQTYGPPLGRPVGRGFCRVGIG